MQAVDMSAATAILGLVWASAGLMMILFSLLSRRHRGQSGGGGFWAPKSTFTSGEYAANRTGFVLSVLGVLALLAATF